MTASTEQKKPLASEFKVGDYVVYNEKESSNWNGGKGKVTAILKGANYPVEVTCLEVPQTIKDVTQNNGLGFLRKTGNFRHKDLILHQDSFNSTQTEMVEHPSHYGGKDDPYEVIKVAEAWGLDKDAYLFNVLKYIARAGKKQDTPTLQDLRKGHFYLGRKITNLVKEKATK